MKRALVLLGIFLCSALPAMAAPAKPVRTYETEKARLIAAGYRPAKIRHPKDPQTGICIGGFCDRYPEAHECHGDRCVLVFKRQRDFDIQLVITTKDVSRVLDVRPPGSQDAPYEAYLAKSSPLYAEVRTQLVAQGYRPVPLRLDDSIGLASYHQKFSEALFCTGIGINICTMAYIRSATGTFMALDVFGEVELSVPYPIRRADDGEIEKIKKLMVRGKK